MLAAEAMRLAAHEALVPTALLSAVDPAWPTIAGDRVFDSQRDGDVDGGVRVVGRPARR